MLTRLLFAASALGALGYLINQRRGTSAQGVRPAGPSQMRNPPRNWDRVDEEMDESFPASDPPANY
ncbi:MULTISPECIES: hypothetical protein [Thioclava]|uniref:Secreted protein n=1 Tax=Thioclava nitratireducens TaxID=1915078 RepID=A0ABM6IF36_9RHOB|nr:MULTISPECIES: hypothetical protein [Thioclava]OWY05939.1 hypothetical protein B6V75_07500 [Thioclava sp. F1Mire-8]AQS47342.1 hypothetical protein BMG03_05685 [Thioclava nitratireducens]OWY04424.1 hypothetical protein B6V76_07835 [Thioclava sp. IC9]OWY11232.1 hypothetical protein B6V74_04230 [Thioclava sp. F42-5]OWY13697.1 hypothetical protein B6V72_06735 [Thioclava sp. F34-6]